MSAKFVCADYLRGRVHRSKQDDSKHTAKQCHEDAILPLDALEARLDLPEKHVVHGFPPHIVIGKAGFLSFNAHSGNNANCRAASRSPVGHCDKRRFP
ncbi:MAG: hypothetical protein ACLQME_09700 [Alphaproteobacteria bacterium]